MKQEEEAVDIDGVDDTSRLPPERNAYIQQTGLNCSSEVDEDALWADEEPDDDIWGWKMKIIVSLDGDDNA